MLSPLPELTDEQRADALKVAQRARVARAVLKNRMKSGQLDPVEALGMEDARKIPVRSFLLAVPGIGQAKADALMESVGIAKSRRVQGLGKRQRAELERELAWARR